MESEKSYWNNRYTLGYSSGDGSYGENLEKKIEFLKGLEVKSITDIGCGDFNFGSTLMKEYPRAFYRGFDASDVVVARDKFMYPGVPFDVFTGYIPKADLLLCMDVLFHIYDADEAQKMLENLKGAWTKYLALTAYERDEEMEGHVRIRKFDPAFFGEPIIREIVEDEGSLYLYLFKR